MGKIERVEGRERRIFSLEAPPTPQAIIVAGSLVVATLSALGNALGSFLAQ